MIQLFDENGNVKTCECKNCGKTVELYNGWANECECGTEYNGFGQMLTSRNEWGYETGEEF